MKHLLFCIFIGVSLAACSAGPSVTDDHQLTMSHVSVEERGKNLDARPNMVSVCKGFLLSDKQVLDFFEHAYYIKENTPDDPYKRLPCFSSGTAMINNDEYHWIIRAGGIGEFFNDTSRFVKICGKHCCDKVPGIC